MVFALLTAVFISMGQNDPSYLVLEITMELFFIYMALIGFAFLLEKTYRIEVRWLKWIFICLPLFLFYPLAMMRMHSFDGVNLWAPVGVFFIYSIITFSFNLIFNLVKPVRRERWIRLVRPGLMILVFLGATEYQVLARQQAIDYMVKMAGQIQKQCDQDGVCPAVIDGWETREGHGESDEGVVYSESDVTRLGVTYGVAYWVDGDVFRFDLAIGATMGVYVDGGIGKVVEVLEYVGED